MNTEGAVATNEGFQEATASTQPTDPTLSVICSVTKLAPPLAETRTVN